ncbi:MAG: hypothetical protein IK079_04890, partial [Desulfovibrio sp.]|nr:hypothetical protein [Desulfovibrio sp.]
MILTLLLWPTILWAWSGQIMNVYNGDTLTVAPLGDEQCPIFVRFYGVDAPNLDQDGGREAKDWLAEKIPEHAMVEVIPMGIDNSG